MSEEYRRDRHGFDPEQSGLIRCPKDPDAPWTWDGEALRADGGLPPFCPACGSRVKRWEVRTEWGLIVDRPSAPTNPARVSECGCCPEAGILDVMVSCRPGCPCHDGQRFIDGQWRQQRNPGVAL